MPYGENEPHPGPGLVQLPKPDIDEMVAGLEALLVRIRAGEITSLLIAAFHQNGNILSVERGRRLDRLQQIGLLESWKSDLIETMETGIPTRL